MIPVDYTTVRRRSPLHRPTALAAKDGTCRTCGGSVSKDEPVVLPPQPIVQDPDGSRHVDLSGAEWVCQRPHGAEVAA